MSQMKLFVLNLLLFVTAITFVFVTSEVVPSESGNIRTYKILEGDSLLVICKTTNSSDIKIYWTKNDTRSTFIQQGKRLEIINIKRLDSGEYICHAFNTSVPAYNESDVNVTVEVINVDVQYPAEIDDFVIEPHELMENATFNVTCDFQANPDPIWSIRNRNTGLQLLSRTVSAKSSIYHKVGCDDTGYWECTGYNILSNGVNITMGQNITVYCSPRPQNEQNQYIVQSVVGKSVTLAMHLLAYPVADYTWTKDDGTDISNASKQENFKRVTLLTFPSMSIPDFGNYTLKMQNEYGIYYASYQLVADGPPETPTNLHFSNVTYNSVKLQWTSGFDMGSRQHFIVMKLHGNVFVQVSGLIYDNSTNHGVNQNWTYDLTNLASDTFYNLTVVSQNERGFWSAFSKPSVSFTTKSKPKSYPETPKHLRFSDVTSNSVKLQWISGCDMGSRQHFIVVRIGENNNIYELPGRIYDNSTNRGINQNWTYVYVGLASDTYYNISILSENERGYRSNYASPTAVFRTRKDPYNVKSSETQVTLIVGLTLGSLGVVGVLAFIVYLVKYRRLRTSYTIMDEKPTKF